LLGIVPVSVFSGVSDRVQRIVAGLDLLMKSDLRSNKWWKKTQRGVPQGFMGSFSSLVLKFQSVMCHGIFADFFLRIKGPSFGQPFSATTAKPSQPWISSPYRLLLSESGESSP
jgi:hypothetical protein